MAKGKEAKVVGRAEATIWPRIALKEKAKAVICGVGLVERGTGGPQEGLKGIVGTVVEKATHRDFAPNPKELKVKEKELT